MNITAGGITFHYTIDGRQGAPWLVFSNSLLTSLSMWDEVATALAADFRILRYDQRGHGGTEAPAGPYSFDLLVADVIALYDALEISRAHFVGLSMGGMTAIALAQQHPERVDRLIACDCAPASTPQSAQQWTERIALAKEQGVEALVEPTVGRWFSPGFAASNRPAVDRVRQMIRTTPLDGFVGCAQALSDFDLRPGLAAIRVPVQFVAGSKDASLAGTKALHAGVAGSTFIEIPDAGHLSAVDEPALFSRAVRDFLEVGSNR
jgi:3-oxoadipate enol-lactonase